MFTFQKGCNLRGYPITSIFGNLPEILKIENIKNHFLSSCNEIPNKVIYRGIPLTL